MRGKFSGDAGYRRTGTDGVHGYLNFFEMVSFLVRKRELGKRDVLVLFHYYLSCLQKHEGVADYIRTHGFEELNITS